MLQDLRYLIGKKLNSVGLKKKFDEKSICAFTQEFLKSHLNGMMAKEVSYYNGSVIIETRSSVEANELRFYEEELIFFLTQKGYKIRKIRILA